MRSYRVLFAAACGFAVLSVSTPAAAKYGYCETYAPNQAAHVTPVFEYPADVVGDGLEPDFEGYMEAKLGFNLMPMCTTYDDEAEARKWQAYVLAQVKQSRSAILDDGFESFLTQKYGGARKTGPARAEVTDGADRHTPSKAVTSAGASAVEERTPAEPKKSAAQAAAEAAAARKAEYEAEFQAKQDEYERLLADRERKVQEFNELQAKMEAQKQANLAAAEAAANAYKQEQEKYAETLRQHQDEVARYNAQVNGTQAAPSGSGNGGRFQATGGALATREQAMASLLSHPKGAELVDIQCDTIKMFDPPKWTCWGFYYQTVTPQAGSKQ